MIMLLKYPLLSIIYNTIFILAWISGSDTTNNTAPIIDRIDQINNTSTNNNSTNNSSGIKPVNLVGGECITLKGELIYLGGKPTTPNTNTNNRTLPYYKLDIKDNFILSQFGEAPWQVMDSKLVLDQPLLYSNLIYDNSREGLLLVGGENTSSNNYIKSVDIKLHRVEANATLSKNFQGPRFYFGMVNAFQEPSIAYLYGGIESIENPGKKLDSRIYKVNLDNGVWTQDNLEGEGDVMRPRYLHGMVMINHLIYVHGGIDPVTNIPYPWDTIMAYDIIKKTWSTLNIKGNIPNIRLGHRVIRYNSETLLIAGGLSSSNDTTLNDIEDGNIYLLSIKDLRYQKLPINGILPSYLPCVQMVNKQLIIGLGYNYLKSFGLVNTKIIDLTNFKIQNQFKARDWSKRRKNPFSIPSYLIPYIGFLASLAILLLLLLIFLIVYCIIYSNKMDLSSSLQFRNKNNESSIFYFNTINSNDNEFRPASPILKPLFNEYKESTLNIQEQPLTRFSLINSDPTLKNYDKVKSAHLSSLDNGDIKIPIDSNSAKNDTSILHRSIHEFEFNKLPNFAKIIERSQSDNSTRSGSSGAKNNGNNSKQIQKDNSNNLTDLIFIQDENVSNYTDSTQKNIQRINQNIDKLTNLKYESSPQTAHSNSAINSPNLTNIQPHLDKSNPPPKALAMKRSKDNKLKFLNHPSDKAILEVNSKEPKIKNESWFKWAYLPYRRRVIPQQNKTNISSASKDMLQKPSIAKLKKNSIGSKIYPLPILPTLKSPTEIDASVFDKIGRTSSYNIDTKAEYLNKVSDMDMDLELEGFDSLRSNQYSKYPGFIRKEESVKL